MPHLQTRVLSVVTSLVLATAVTFTVVGALAADDPSIQGDARTGIQAAMTAYIAAQKVGGESLLHYDAVSGDLRRLTLVELHAGIVKKGHFFVSCADFAQEDGTLVDVDFLVVPTDDGFRVNQAIVHSVAGKKRAYHLEQQWPGLF